MLTDGWGVAAALFRDAGIPVVDEDHLKDLPNALHALPRE